MFLLAFTDGICTHRFRGIIRLKGDKMVMNSLMLRLEWKMMLLEANYL